MLNLSGRRRLPNILQAEAAECGLACIAMIASYHGYECDLFSLRRRFGSSARGTNLQSIMELADSLELSSRALRVDLDELGKLSLPAILHWNFNHFVVLKSIRGRTVTVHDPAVGVRRYTLTELSMKFTGVALELIPRSSFLPGSDRTELKIWHFWKGAKGLYPSLVQILCLSLLVQVFALAMPFYMQLVVDEVMIKYDQDLLVVLGLGFAGLIFLSVMTKAVRGYSLVYLTNQLSFNMGNSVMHHLLRLPMEYFNKRHMGDVISRFQSINPIQDFISSGSIAIVIDGLLATTTLVMMFFYSPLLTLVVLVSVLVYGLFRVLQFRPLRDSQLENIGANAKLDSLFIESISSLQGIKMAGREMQRENIWRHQFVDTIDTSAKIGRLTVTYETVNNFVRGAEHVLVIFLAANHVLEGALSIGMVYAFMSFRTSFTDAVTSVINEVMQFKMVGLHLERLADITNSAAETGLIESGMFTVPIHGQLILQHVSFHYPGTKTAVLSDLSLEVPQGNFVALYGPSGVGKSTLLRVMMGLIEPTAGKMMVDNQELSKIGMRSYRSSIAAVTQEDILFSGSIQDNITFFDLAPDPALMTWAAQKAEIHLEITQMVMGYESQVGQMGMTMSQGQRQRIIIARALYRQPKILFLDEGTAHIDKLCALKIMTNIREMNLTCVYVSHDTDLLEFSDRVIHWSGQGSISVSQHSMEA